jgi:hypothetical protein
MKAYDDGGNLVHHDPKGGRPCVPDKTILAAESLIQGEHTSA